MTPSLHMSNPQNAQVPHAIRALLLDDNKFDRTRIRRLSDKTELPLHLDEVGSIKEMEKAVRKVAYDLIMIDYRLPVGDGLAALKRIHTDPLNKDAGTIMITGNAELDTAVAAMRVGCHDFLTKDKMTAQQLKSAIVHALNTAQERRPGGAFGDAQKDIIRQSLTAALSDTNLQDRVAKIMRQNPEAPHPVRPRFWSVQDPKEIDNLLAGLDDDDEFIFH